MQSDTNTSYTRSTIISLFVDTRGVDLVLSVGVIRWTPYHTIPNYTTVLTLSNLELFYNGATLRDFVCCKVSIEIIDEKINQVSPYPATPYQLVRHGQTK